MINADQAVGAYWIQLRGLGECGIKRAQQLGILRYARGPYQPASPPPTYDVGLPQGVVSRAFHPAHLASINRFYFTHNQLSFLHASYAHPPIKPPHFVHIVTIYIRLKFQLAFLFHIRALLFACLSRYRKSIVLCEYVFKNKPLCKPEQCTLLFSLTLSCSIYAKWQRLQCINNSPSYFCKYSAVVSMNLEQIPLLLRQFIARRICIKHAHKPPKYYSCTKVCKLIASADSKIPPK